MERSSSSAWWSPGGCSRGGGTSPTLRPEAPRHVYQGLPSEGHDPPDAFANADPRPPAQEPNGTVTAEPPAGERRAEPVVRHGRLSTEEGQRDLGEPPRREHEPARDAHDSGSVAVSKLDH